MEKWEHKNNKKGGNALPVCQEMNWHRFFFRSHAKVVTIPLQNRTVFFWLLLKCRISIKKKKAYVSEYVKVWTESKYVIMGDRKWWLIVGVKYKNNYYLNLSEFIKNHI